MTDIAKTEAPWLTAVKSAEATFIKNCPDKERFEREFVFACQALRNNTFMQGCSVESIKSAIINIALTGATLNPIMQQAFLIPRSLKINGQKVLTCCLDFSYRGLIGLAVDGGSIIDMDATVVHKEDLFEMEQGFNPILKHIPVSKDRGEIVGVYAIAVYKAGHKKFIHLTREDIELVRKTSQAPNSPMWKDHYGEGARKSAIKKLYKMLPQTDRMSQAINVLNEFEGLGVLENKGDDVTKRFQTPEALPEGTGDPLEPDYKDSLPWLTVCAIEGIKSLRELDIEYEHQKSQIENHPDKDKIIEAFDYRRSELKEKEGDDEAKV